MGWRYTRRTVNGEVRDVKVLHRPGGGRIG